MRGRLCIVACIWLLLQAAAAGGTPSTPRSEGALTTVVGEVLDARTGVPVAGVNVWFEGTSYGTTTTEEGVFLLRAPLKKKTHMAVSAVGYRRERFAVEPGLSAGIDVALTESDSRLEEVFVVPGSNPALPLMERVRARRHANDLPAAPAAEEDLSVYVSGIEARHLRRRLWKSLEGAMQTAGDSTRMLPLYRRRNRHGTTSEETLMLTAGDWKVLLDDFRQPPDFYHNTVSFCGTPFLSPLAGDGNRYYRYYLADSLQDGGKGYLIHFRTKNPYHATFNGEMLIDSATCALRRIEVAVAPETNVNYLRGLTVRQTYAANGDTSHYILQEARTALLFDVAVKADSSGLFPTLAVVSAARYETASDPQDAAVRPPDRELVPDTAAADLPLLRTVNWLAHIVQTGYIGTGTAVEIGNVTEILHVNPWETVRVGFPLRTNERFSRTVCLEGFAAYGFGDRAWKGAGMVHFRIPAPRWHTLTLRYADEYVRPDAGVMMRMRGENRTWYRDMAFTTGLTEMMYWHESSARHQAVRRREGSLRMENAWTDRVETTLLLAGGREGYGTPTRDYGAQPSFGYASVTAVVRIGWDERTSDLHFRRIRLYGRKPTLYLSGEIGSIHPEGSDNYHLYGRFGVMLRHRADLGFGGRIDWTAEAGILAGKVPYSRLHLFEGNQSYAFDVNRFTLMSYGQYGADRYLQAHAEWNGRGCLLNRIPWVQRLRLRELLILKIAWGTWSDRHVLFADGADLPARLMTPYLEAGAGIGNILRIGNLYAVFRLPPYDAPGTPWWALRFRLQVEP